MPCLRTNVHEIGSALAQAVMDDMDSDDSLMAEDTLMTILQQLQQDIDTGQIDEKLLDKALASLVSSYGQVLRGRSNIDVIKVNRRCPCDKHSCPIHLSLTLCWPFLCPNI